MSKFILITDKDRNQYLINVDHIAYIKNTPGHYCEVTTLANGAYQTLVVSDYNIISRQVQEASSKNKKENRSDSNSTD